MHGVAVQRFVHDSVYMYRFPDSTTDITAWHCGLMCQYADLNPIRYCSAVLTTNFCVFFPGRVAEADTWQPPAGSLPIGAREMDTWRSREVLGCAVRRADETISDMARAMS
jgi:hypothetical protein